MKKPKKGDYPTYLEAYKKDGRDATGPYFEDMDWKWRQNKSKK
jgi:hypothetical protein